MAKNDQNNSNAQPPAGNAKSTVSERDAAAKAVRDNMARLKALRLAREAAEPPRPAATPRKAAARPKSKQPGEKAPGLSDWLAGQQNGGRRI
jgi:hypothetical protein